MGGLGRVKLEGDDESGIGKELHVGLGAMTTAMFHTRGGACDRLLLRRAWWAGAGVVGEGGTMEGDG